MASAPQARYGPAAMLRASRLIRSALAAACLLAVAGQSAAAAPPRRVASLNVCADQLLLALAPEAVASLSPLSRDPRLSFAAAQARGVPVNSGRGEVMSVERPDLVLAGRYDGKARRDFMESQGIDVLLLEAWTSLAHGREQIMTLAARLGVPERGEALVSQIDAALERTRAIAPGGRTVLPLQVRGYTPGEASLVAELLRHMGLVPFQQRLGLKDGGFVRLEQVVATPPDFLLLGTESARAIDQGSALLVHPALSRAVPAERRLVLRAPLLTCGGPSLVAAIDALAAEIRAKVR